VTLWLGLVQNEGKGCPKWGKREVRRQESGDRMGQNTVKDILQDGCPEWGKGVQNEGNN